MKLLVVSSIAIILAEAAVGQQPLRGSVILSGNLASYRVKAAKVQFTFQKPAGGYIFDSAEVKNDTFYYSRALDEPMVCLVSITPAAVERGTRIQGQQDYMQLFLIPSRNTIQLTDSLLATATIKGASEITSTQYRMLSDKWNASNVTQRQLVQAAKEKGADEDRISMIKDSMDLLTDQLFRAFVTQNSTSPVAVKALHLYATRPVWTPRKDMAPDTIALLVRQLPASFKKLPSMLALEETLAIARLTAKGKPALTFSLPDTSGKVVHLSDFKGRYVFVDFWASWCVPCRKENPNVVKLYNRYKDSGLTVLSVSLDRPGARDAWLEAIRKDNIGNWAHVSDLKGFDSAPAKMYHVKSIPSNFLIDPDGKFVGRNLYGKKLEEALEKVFSNN